jgi:hypothetical protein
MLLNRTLVFPGGSHCEGRRYYRTIILGLLESEFPPKIFRLKDS